MLAALPRIIDLLNNTIHFTYLFYFQILILKNNKEDFIFDLVLYLVIFLFCTTILLDIWLLLLQESKQWILIKIHLIHILSRLRTHIGWGKPNY